MFYANDFRSSSRVKLMGRAGRGDYIMLLSAAWDDGSIPNDVEQLAVLADAPLADFKKTWPKIEGCWVPMKGDPTRLVNAKMEEIRSEQQAWRDKLSYNGKRGVEAKRGKQPKPPDDASRASSRASSQAESGAPIAACCLASNGAHSQATSEANSGEQARAQGQRLQSSVFGIQSSHPAVVCSPESPAPAREITPTTRDLGTEATKHHTQHDDVIGDEEIADLPRSPISAVPSPVLDFAKWFVLSGIEAGVIPRHHKLAPIDYALDRDGKLKAANQIIETYGRAECEVRTHRLFRAINAKVCNTASIEALSTLWDKPDIAGVAGVPATPRLHVAGEYDSRPPLPLRGFEMDKRRSEDVPVIGTPRTKCPACGASDHTEIDDCAWLKKRLRKNA